jgi:hypothetical protein
MKLTEREEFMLSEALDFPVHRYLLANTMEIGGAEMKTKTCGDCKHFMDGRCNYGDEPFEVEKGSPYCDDRFFEPAPKPTNGDVIRQGGDTALLAYRSNAACYHCSFRGTESCKSDFSNCKDGQLAWLNAPAEINTEREGEDER